MKGIETDADVTRLGLVACRGSEAVDDRQRT